MRSTRLVILDLISDDSYGLWEIAASLSESLPDGISVLAVGRDELLALLEEGLIEISHVPSSQAPECAVGPEEGKAYLANDQYWSVPRGDAEEVRVTTTDQGFEVYEAMWHAECGRASDARTEPS